MRVGVGYDSHRFAAGRTLVLGGVAIPHDRGLDGWSDADAVAHALTDAILGAAGLGDIGRLFPPDDATWRDADSLELLGTAHQRALAAGHQFAHGDITVVAEQPRLAPYVDRMQERLAGALGVPPGRVSVKAKTNEGMGWIGRGEGIAVIAVALLE
jgi:2-C-methyl-D-erythritol 2,4-cyclodiphosphate synthase